MPPPVENAAAGDRIAKLLARAGVASRREVERMIAEGRVARNGVPLDTAAVVLPSLDGVTVDGNPVASAAPARLFLYHKPPGLLVTERDPRGRPTIYDRLPDDLPRVVPVGRLDLATEGLLLLTTDGGLKRQLELPATGVERAYRARAYGQVTQAQLEALIEGVEIEGVRYGPIDANLERRTGANVWIELILTEGKNREVRRVLEHLGLQVGRLIRTRYGPFVLADLPPGEVGEVRQADLVHFRQTLGRKQPHAQPIGVTGSSRPATVRQPRPKPLPGEGRGQAAVNREARDTPARQAGTTRRVGSFAHPKALPGEGRGPVVVHREERTTARTFAPRQRSDMGQIAYPRPVPNESRGPGAMNREKRTTPAKPAGRTARSAGRPDTSSTPRPAAKAAGERRTPGSSSPQLDPGLRRGGASAATGRSKPDAEIAAPARPAKPQRKAGWAKPKPKTGPKRPRKS